MKRASICFFFLAFLFFVFSSTQQQQQNPQKLPASVSQTLVHYATSKTTPQQTLKEISVTERVLRRKSPCNFLVFGLGHDSPLWSSLNSGGRTVFLDENPTWIDRMRADFPDLEFFHVSYDTKLPQADELLRSAESDSAACGAVVDPRDSKCVLALKSLPKEVYEVEWDVIMVDAPTGYHNESPGRMTAIYTAGLMARNRLSGGETDVMVHDVDRPVEDRFSRAFLCKGYLKEEEGKLRHFVVPSHRDRRPGSPLCP